MEVLYIVVPCYNEQEVLPETTKRLLEKLNTLIAKEKISADSRILYVDDGSKDKTWELIAKAHAEDVHVAGLKLSRNRGHQNALLAGLMTAKSLCDICISMDADLQDDIEAIDAMLEKHRQGCDIVYGVRSSRKKDTFFKRNSALAFYRFMKALGVEMVDNHAEYRLMSRRALEGLASFPEVNLFLRGIVPLIGFPSGTVEYERGERFAGETKYPLKKMLGFAFDGITSFSVKPIRFVFSMGILLFLVSIAVLIYSLVVKLLGHTVTGWTTVMISIWMIGGIQLLCLGVIGEYIGKIYQEVKHRPAYIIEAFLNDPVE
ncbi:MAG TPA: glycosyltransferase family 2 protein [Firmicutes bacterium]|nr:glycosyltransferase family 2 protein [Bacillota bacterium]